MRGDLIPIPKVFFPEMFLNAVPKDKFLKTSEIAKVVGCHRQTATAALTQLHDEGYLEMEWTSGGKEGTRKWKKIKDKDGGTTTVTVGGARSGKFLKAFEDFAKGCKHKEPFGACGERYSESKKCNSVDCPLVIRR